MKKLVVTYWISLDGFIADRNGGMDWLRGDDEMSAYEIGVVSDADTLLLGEKTYQDFSGYWPHVPDNPKAMEWEKTYARKLNGLDKVVVSRTLQKGDWGDPEILRELTPNEIQRLKDRGGQNILTYGSASVVQRLANFGLIDEFHLLVHPVILGGGRALFENIEKRIDLDRAKVEPFKSGVLLLVYRPVAA